MARLTFMRPLAAFLDLIAHCEGTSNSPFTKDEGYDIMAWTANGGTRFTDYSAHPFQSGREPILVQITPNIIRSTASGRYQITLPTWQRLATNSNSRTFSPRDQDLAAIQLLAEYDVIKQINSRRIETAVIAASTMWPSLAKHYYSKAHDNVSWILHTYNEFLNFQQ